MGFLDSIRDGVSWVAEKLGIPVESRTTDVVMADPAAAGGGYRVRSTYRRFADGHISGSLMVVGTVAATTWAGVGFSGAGELTTTASPTPCGVHLVAFSVDGDQLDGPVAVPANGVWFAEARADTFHLVEFDDDETYAIPSNAIATVRDDGDEVHLVRLGEEVFALPASAIPSNGIPSNALPASALPALAIPSNAIPSNALPASALPAAALPASARIDDDVRALPASALPAAALPASVRPTFHAVTFDDGLTYAIPSNAVGAGPEGASWVLLGDTAAALPASALPAAALPAAALPASVLPPSAIPSNALPASALPASALPASYADLDTRAIPSNALPASARQGLDAVQQWSPLPAVRTASFRLGGIDHALPASALSTALPASAIPAEAIAVSALPAAAIPSNALPAAALPASVRSELARVRLPDVAALSPLGATAVTPTTVDGDALSVPGWSQTSVSWLTKHVTTGCSSLLVRNRSNASLVEQLRSYRLRELPVPEDDGTTAERYLVAGWRVTSSTTPADEPATDTNDPVAGPEIGGPADAPTTPADDDTPTPEPTAEPSPGPSTAPSTEPSTVPTEQPTGEPTEDPTDNGTTDRQGPTFNGFWTSEEEIHEQADPSCGPTTIEVSVLVDDPSGVASVDVNHRVAARLGSTPLTATGSSWDGQLGPFPTDTITSGDSAPLEVEVVATDTAGNETVAEATFTLLDCAPADSVAFPAERTSSHASVSISPGDAGTASGHGSTFDVGQSVSLCWSWDWSPDVDVHLLGWPDEPYRADGEPSGSPATLDVSHESEPGNACGAVSLSPGGYHVFRVELREPATSSGCEAPRCGDLLAQAQIWVWVEG